MDIRWNKDEESSFCKDYKKNSKSFLQRQQESAWDFKKKALQVYNLIMYCNIYHKFA